MAEADIVQTLMVERASSEMKNKAEIVLQEARRLGADGAEVGLSVSQGLSVTTRLGEVDTLEFHRDKGVSLTVYAGQCKGSASSSDDSVESLKEAVAAAFAIARNTEADAYAGLANEKQFAHVIPDLDLHHPWLLSPQQAIDMAQEMERQSENEPRIINSDGATVSSGESCRVFATSEGFMGSYPSSSHSMSCVLVGEQDGAMQRDYWYDSSRDADQLMAPAQIGIEARQRVLARLGAGRMDTGDMPVLFMPQVAAGIFGHFLSAIQGAALYRKSSFLLDSMGEKVFPDWMQIHERPHLLKGNSSAPFDSDGLPTAEKVFVKQGVVETYALGLYASRRLAMEPTANGGGVRNVYVADNGHDFEALLSQMNNGVVVTELMGQGVNLVTGDYSRGAAGFRVRNGKLAEPVEEFTVAGNLKEMFASILSVGVDRDSRGNVNCGSLLVERMKIAGN